MPKGTKLGTTGIMVETSSRMTTDPSSNWKSVSINPESLYLQFGESMATIPELDGDAPIGGLKPSASGHRDARG